MKVYLDIAPLYEKHWTGIPVVTAAVARHGLRDTEFDWRFLYNNQEMLPEVVDELLMGSTGRYLAPRIPQDFQKWTLPSYEDADRSVGIFPNVKPVRNLFAREALILHDLSTLLTPEYHHRDTINHHGDRLLLDVQTTDHFFCVSGATADDLTSYFKVDPKQVEVCHLGVEWPLPVRLEAARILRNKQVKPFVLVLGTVEPRKNIQIVLEYLAEHPQILRRYTFVFAGREGWLAERERLESIMASAGVDPDSVYFTGFVSEPVKLALLQSASFTIYPSMFEGFGLPVLEAVSVGSPVLCSFSSSMPEVDERNCVFFDPTDPISFALGLMRMESSLGSRASRNYSAAGLLQNREEYSWSRFLEPIQRWLRTSAAQLGDKG